jgi:hypothetical protein
VGRRRGSALGLRRSVWTAPLPSALQNLSLLGVGTTADAGNPFAAKLNATLWTAKTVA